MRIDLKRFARWLKNVKTKYLGNTDELRDDLKAARELMGVVDTFLPDKYRPQFDKADRLLGRLEAVVDVVDQ